MLLNIRSSPPPGFLGFLGDADYEGHSLAMLNRIARALDRRVEINFVPIARST